MLTADLVRARVSRGVVIPRYVAADDPRPLAAAQALIAAFADSVGDVRAALDDAVADHIGDSPDFMLHRGLVKLLMDRSELAVIASVPPAEARAVVFAASAAAYPVGDLPGMTPRAVVMASVAAQLGVTPEALTASLFADLKGAERVLSVPAMAPETLLARYNLGLAQASLLRAREVRVTLTKPKPKRVRQLFRFIKFRRLMVRSTRLGDDYTLVLDGPLSLFRHTGRYGLQMALLLPALCLCERWSLEADIVWGKARFEALFRCDNSTGLTTELKDTGTWEGAEEKHFVKGFKKLKSGWRLRRSARIVDLDGRGVLVPDYLLKGPNGREALLELVWTWRRRGLAERLALLRQHGPPNLIVAVAGRLNADRHAEALEDPRIYTFKGVIAAKRVVALAEAWAR